MPIDEFNPPKYIVCKIERYADLCPQIPKLRCFIFRGHKCSSWPLSSPLAREYGKYKERQMIEGVEKDSIEYFRKRSHSFEESNRNSAGLVDLLASMQHYGCPTRLVDFTHSFYIATYFAVNDSSELKENFCVWAFNFPVLHAYSKQFSNAIFGSKDTSEQLDNTIHNFVEPKGLGVIIAEPEKFSRRMAAQQGVLLAQTEIRTSFETNLHSLMATKNEPIEINLEELSRINQNIINDIRIIKFEFNENCIHQVRRELLQMNVTSEILFPDISGMAKSAIEHLFWQ
jgi:hypothetical protein